MILCVCKIHEIGVMFMFIKGSNIAKDIDMQFRKEQRYKQRQFEKQFCEKCKNQYTSVCNIVHDIEGKLKCSEFVKMPSCEMVEKGLCVGCTGLAEKDWNGKENCEMYKKLKTEGQ